MEKRIKSLPTGSVPRRPAASCAGGGAPGGAPGLEDGGMLVVISGIFDTGQHYTTGAGQLQGGENAPRAIPNKPKTGSSS